MRNKIVLIFLLALTAQANMTSFYKDAMKTLQYEKSYNLYETSNKTSQSAVTYSKYANFTLDGAYSKTYAQYLPTSSGSFNTTDISLHDTLDLFGKNNYKIQTLRLDVKSEKKKLSLKKEQLFISLVNMVALYNKTQMQLKIHQELYKKQQKIYVKLEGLAKNGDITALDILRFKNTLTTLQTKIVA
ncbi:TolC family protein, partial [Sulfurimonas sp.]|uniref:TolC family protein n=1 Tax=Sulfurimonas sp. TaxID=2022749 RepID=UPI00261A4D16